MEFQSARTPTAALHYREETAERHPGFTFENALRNDLMARQLGQGEVVQTSAKKTGTTICGITFANGVVLGADTRATGGSEVCDKNCEKIHYIAPNIFCCGAGTAADTEKTTEMIASQLELQRLNARGVESRTVTACTLLKRMLYRYQGHVSAALVLGGVDAMGVHLYDVYPHGSTSKLPYVSMGSGSLAAMSVLEMKYRDDLEEAEAVEVVKEAIHAGIFNDLGSGSNVDITVIRKDKLQSGERSVEQFRGIDRPNEVSELRARIARPGKLRVAIGGTATLSSTFEAASVPIVVEDADAMQL